MIIKFLYFLIRSDGFGLESVFPIAVWIDGLPTNLSLCCGPILRVSGVSDLMIGGSD